MKIFLINILLYKYFHNEYDQINSFNILNNFVSLHCSPISLWARILVFNEIGRTVR